MMLRAAYLLTPFIASVAFWALLAAFMWRH